MKKLRRQKIEKFCHKKRCDDGTKIEDDDLKETLRNKLHVKSEFVDKLHLIWECKVKYYTSKLQLAHINFRVPVKILIKLQSSDFERNFPIINLPVPSYFVH